MVKDRKDFRPFLLKVGVALALSFAGFLYTRLKATRNKCNRPPQSPHSSDHINESDTEAGRTHHRDDLHAVTKTDSGSNFTSISAEVQEKSYMLKATVDNAVIGLSPNSKHSTNKDGCLLPEFNDLVRELDLVVANAGVSPKKDEDTPQSDVGIARAFVSKEKDDYEEEIKHLKHRVRILQERERKLEGQLLEFYGLKEQETTVMELQNRLKINNVEIKFLALKNESLKRENRTLQEQLADHAKIAAELDAARTRLKLLKKKLRTESEHNREQILTLKRRVSRLQEQDLTAGTTDLESNYLQRLKDLEAEAEELRKSNLTLHLENSELAQQLESTQIIANSILEDKEKQVLREYSNRLRQENAELAKEIEQLQADRCADAEELVYLRWINACLRYELRNFQPPYGKTVARDLSKSLSPKSEEKAKQLILEYASNEGRGEMGNNIMDFESDHWSASQAAYFTESGDFDESSLSSKANNSSKMNFFNKLRRILRGKDNHHDHHGSSEDKTGGVEDSDSDHGVSSSTVTSQTLSMNSSRQSSRHSMDFQRLRSTKMDDRKDVENIQRISDVGSSSSYMHRRYSSRGGASDVPLENRLEQDLYSNDKSELLKFADALKDSGHKTRSIHRKAVSLGSFEAFKRAGSG